MRIKILIATCIFPPDIGGPAEYASKLAETWKSLGHGVIVKSFTPALRKLPTGIRHLCYFIKIIPAVMMSDTILALDTFSVGLPALLAAKIFGKNICIRTGGDFLWESYVERTGQKVLLRNFYDTAIDSLNSKERKIFAITKFVLNKVDCVIFSTAWQRDMFIKAYGLDPSSTAIVENYYGPKEPRLEPVQKIVVSGTRKLKWKNTDMLDKVFARPDIKELGYINDDINRPYKEFMENIARSYAVILVSLGDISPNFILDAIRYNKPCIVTKETGIVDRIKDCVLFVDPLDEADIASKLVWLSDPANYKALSDKVRAFTFTHTWEQIANSLLELMRAGRVKTIYTASTTSNTISNSNEQRPTT